MTLLVDGLTTPLLPPVHFTLAAGECVAVRGDSGAGKTVLLRALADLDPNTGRVELDGIAREALAAPDWRKRVRYLPAEPAWWGETAGEHFTDRAAAVPLVEQLRLTASCLDAPIAHLSTGERQRLALVRALLPRPRVLLADEPTAALDAAAVAAAEALIAAFRAEGMAVLWVSHDAAQARRVAGRALRIAVGGLSEESV